MFYSNISPFIFLCDIFIVPNQRSIVVHYGLSLIAVRGATYTQISVEYVIKNVDWGVIAGLGQFSVHSKKQAVYLRFIFNCCARQPTHIKMSGEYVIKKRWLKVYCSCLRIQFVIFNPWKLPWNWIAFYQNSFVISPDLFITWLDATMDDLQTRPLRQILLFLWNNSLTV